MLYPTRIFAAYFQTVQRNQEHILHSYSVISSIEDYIKDVKSENPILEEVQGELVIAKHIFLILVAISLE